MKVYYGHKTRYSGRILERALANVEGEDVNWGYPVIEDAINPSEAIRLASNKRVALTLMAAQGVPVPEFTTDLPAVARPDKHFGGSGFFLCQTFDDVLWADEHGATHLLAFIEGGREFRVHVAFGKSIKVAEKIGGNPLIRNFKHGSKFMYPQNFEHKKTLRKLAKRAVRVLGLDFGAVDIIWKDGKWYVLEVNTAPSLTSNSDVLDRYIKAFTDNAS